MITEEVVAQLGKERDPYKRLVQAAKHVGPGDIMVDCGANLGRMSRHFLARGCEVHAFEPDPVAFSSLQQSFGTNPSMHLYQAAVGTKYGTSRLFFHAQRASVKERPEVTQGSSLMADKTNIDRKGSVLVNVVDLVDFLCDLPKRVEVLKIDIEGAEAGILERLVTEGRHGLFGVAFVETHEDKVPSSLPVMERVRAEIERLQIKHIFLDWG